jgi:PST family polysaccharide transporter
VHDPRTTNPSDAVSPPLFQPPVGAVPPAVPDPSVNPDVPAFGDAEASIIADDLDPGHPALDPSHTGTDLKGRSVRGGLWTGGAQMVALMVQICSTAVLARLLEPADFGLVGMVLAFTGLFMIFQDLGLSEATIQRPRITHDQVSKLFFVNVGIGIALTVLLAALTPAVVALYDEPRLWALTPVMALVFVFAGFTAQHVALLKRQLRFKALALTQLASMTLGVAAGITSAMLSLGVWSLVVMALTQVGGLMIGATLISGWFPSMPKRRTEIRGLLKFGFDVTICAVVMFLARNADNVLIGRYLGALTLGLYTKAYGLLLLPLRQLVRPLTGVAVPTLARLQDQPDRYRRYYLRVTKIIAYTTIPMTAVLAAVSPSLIAVMLGPGWEGAVWIFKWLAIAGLLQAVFSTGSWVLQSLGRTAELRNLGLIVSPIYVASFVIGLPYGATGVAFVYAIAVNLTFIPAMWFSLRGSPIGLGVFLQQLIWPLILGGLCYVFVFAGMKSLDTPAIVDMLGLTPLGTLLALGVVWLLSATVRQDLRETLELIRELRPGRRDAAAPN